MYFSVGLAFEALELLQRISRSSVDNALLLGPCIAALHKTVMLPGRLAQVEWREAHPQDQAGSALGRMWSVAAAGPRLVGAVGAITGQVRAAAAAVRAERLPQSWFELQEDVVRFAAALSRLNACGVTGHASAAVSGVNGVQSGSVRCGGGVPGSAAARQQLAAALDALAASSSTYHSLTTAVAGAPMSKKKRAQCMRDW